MSFSLTESVPVSISMEVSLDKEVAQELRKGHKATMSLYDLLVILSKVKSSKKVEVSLGPNGPPDPG